MEKIVLKIANPKGKSIGKYKNNKDIKHLLEYVVTDKDTGTKVKYWDCRGLVRNIKDSVKIISSIQKYMGKDEGRRMYHFIISFPEKVDDLNIVCIVADAIADYIGQEYQLMYGIHTNTNNLHIHIAMNSVSYRTGLKWHKNKTEFAQWKKHVVSIAESILKDFFY